MGSSIPSTSRSPPTYKGNTIFVPERKTKLAKEDNGKRPIDKVLSHITQL
jgi:hypothetical protein